MDVDRDQVGSRRSAVNTARYRWLARVFREATAHCPLVQGEVITLLRMVLEGFGRHAEFASERVVHRRGEEDQETR